MKTLNDWIDRESRSRMHGYRTIASACGVRWQTAQKWLRRGIVPVARVAAVSRVTDIPPQNLNPHVAELLKGMAA